MAPTDTPAAPTPTPAAPAAAEDAFLKRLKGLTTYTDMFATAAASADPASTGKMITSVVPAVAKEGLEGFMRNTAATAAAIAKEKGANAHPATRYCADEFGKLSDDDFKGLVKPLRVMVQAIQKSKLPAPQAPRAWVGDKRKPF